MENILKRECLPDSYQHVMMVVVDTGMLMLTITKWTVFSTVLKLMSIAEPLWDVLVHTAAIIMMLILMFIITLAFHVMIDVCEHLIVRHLLN